RPQPIERIGTAGPRNRRDERFALRVLLELDVHTGQAHDGPLERRPPGVSALVELLTDPLDARDKILADLVHDVVAEALEQAHDRLRLAEQCALLLGHEGLHPVLDPGAVAADRPAEAAQRLPTEAARLPAEQPELPF